jgi:hypothetical protein
MACLAWLIKQAASKTHSFSSAQGVLSMTHKKRKEYSLREGMVLEKAYHGRVTDCSSLDKGTA